MSYTVELTGEAMLVGTWRHEVVAAVAATLRQQEVSPPAEVAVLLTDDAHMRALNHKFRGEDKSTDVLSFTNGEPAPDMAEAVPYLGDIAISVPTAERQAAAAGHTTGAELQLLAVHGVLHLLGYEHAVPQEKERMWRAQTAVLAVLGLEHILPTEM